MAPPFTFDRRWRFDCGVAELWALLARTDAYPSWLPWLDRFESAGLVAGAEARFVVRPPLPYRLRLAVRVDRVEPAALVDTTVSGDLAGNARLELAAAPDGTTDARMVWALRLQRPMLVTLERVARPAMVWGHDRVVAVGVEQFRRRALRAVAVHRRDR